LRHIAEDSDLQKTASVVWWSTDPEARVRFPTLPKKM
jgi:hypothetical protein